MYWFSVDGSLLIIGYHDDTFIMFYSIQFLTHTSNHEEQIYFILFYSVLLFFALADMFSAQVKTYYIFRDCSGLIIFYLVSSVLVFIAVCSFNTVVLFIKHRCPQVNKTHSDDRSFAMCFKLLFYFNISYR